MSKLCWQPEHAEQLKRLRLAAGVEITTLAKKHSLSSSQVHQLEESGDSAFYSPEIKYTVGRKLIRSLGEEITELDFDGQFGSMALAEAPPLTAANLRPPDIDKSPEQRPHTPKHWRVPLLLMLLILVLAWYGISVTESSKQTPAVKASAPITSEPYPIAQQLPSHNHTPALSNIGSASNEPSTSPVSECDWSSPSLDLTPASGSRPGHYIHVVAAQPVVVCWKDSAQAQRKITLKPEESLTLEGRPPFHLYSTNLSGIKIFYLGNLIRTPTAGVQYVLLGKN
jgi:hypothetical protein